MLQFRLRPFVCRQCLALGASNSLSSAGSPLFRLAVRKTPTASKSYSSQPLSRLFAQLHETELNDGNPQPPVETLFEGEIPDWLPVRERLRAWDTAHPQGKVSNLSEILPQSGLQDIRNSQHGTQSSQSGEMEPEMEDDLNSDLDRPDLGEDFQAMSIYLNPGDLIEARAGPSRAPLLAIFICQRDGLSYFYCSDGSLHTRFRPVTNFLAPRFATEAEMAHVKDRLPPLGTPALVNAKLGKLVNDGGPTRKDGQVLLNKMAKFLVDTDLALQENHDKLDNPHPILAKLGYQHMTSHEAAEHLLSGRERDIDGKFPPAAVYAVHRAMQSCETGLRICQRAVFDMKSCLFEVLAPNETESISAVETMVRNLYADPMALQDGILAEQRLMRHKLGSFIIRARQKIDQSRRQRQFKEESTIMGPHRPQDQNKDVTGKPWLLPEDEHIMKFMHLWAAKAVFDGDARANVFGSQILRAVRRYDGSEILGKSIGWRFLQEIGWVLPWDVQTRYRKAVPGTIPNRSGGLAADLGPLPAEDLNEDPYPGTRKDWGDLPAFAVDSAETQDIDDAVSVERTLTPGQFWIHVHVADVASVIRPNTPHAKHAERVSETHYFPGHFSRMFPDPSISTLVSLVPGSRALTFSGLVNEQGELIEYKITPGILRNVVNIEPEEVAKICPVTEHSYVVEEPPFTLSVGERSGSYFESIEKKSKTATELSAREIEDLKLLDRLASCYHIRRRKNNAGPDRSYGWNAVPSIWPGNTQFRQAADGTFSSSGDVGIEVTRSSQASRIITRLVSNSMILAGEIAGRWCEDRGIPVPYRTMPQAAMNMDALLSWVNNHLYPKLEGNKEPTPEESIFTNQLAGPAVLSTNPGSHFWLGLDHYVKVTSPMRRYLDLVAHFQIHAALAEEARTGKSLQPLRDREKDHTFLPFTRTDLAAKLPLFAVREAKVRTLSNGRRQGHKEYVHQALARAFYFNEAPLPSTLEFHVKEGLRNHRVRGSLPGMFDLFADLVNPNGVVASPSLLRKDDIIEVKLKCVNPFSGEVFVEGVRALRVGAKYVGKETPTPVATGVETVGDAGGRDVIAHALA